MGSHHPVHPSVRVGRLAVLGAVAQVAASYTGKYLREVLAKHGAGGGRRESR